MCSRPDHLVADARTSDQTVGSTPATTLVRVRRDVRLWEQTTERLVATNNLAHPPVWIFLVKNRNDIATLQLEFFRLLGLEVVTRDHFRLFVKKRTHEQLA